MWWTIAAVVGSLTLVFEVVFAYVLTKSMLRPPFSAPQHAAPLSPKACAPAWGAKTHDPRTDFGIDYEEIVFQSGGVIKLPLHGWFVDKRSQAGAVQDTCVVFVHGGGRDRRAFLRHLPLFVERGYSCLMFDTRGHGASGGTGMGLSFGLHEHEDVMEAIKYAQTRGFKYVVLCGTSIGGASVLLAAHKTHGRAIRGLIVENAFTSVEDNVAGIVHLIGFRRLLCKYRKRPHELAWPLEWLCIKLTVFMVTFMLGFSRVRHKDHAAIRVVEHLQLPILFMHGKDDFLIDYHHTIKLYEAAKTRRKHLWLAEGAIHCALYDAHPDLWVKHVFNFMDEVMALPPPVCQ